MLGDWYFSCCIGNNPRQTRALLAILDTLDSPHSNAAQISLAYGELPRMQGAERLYAFPHVLRSLRRADRPEGWAYPVMPYIAGLTIQIPNAEQRQEVDQLLRCATEKTSPAGLMVSLTQCLRWIVPRGADRAQADSATSTPERPSPTSTPYLDVTHFVPEALWLAVAVHAAAGDDEVVAALRGAVGGVDSTGQKRAFVNDALDGRFGRLAQRLAADLARLLRDSPTATIARLRQAEDCVVPFEPDLMQSVAQLVFAQKTLPELLQEVVTLAEFAETIGRHAPANRDAYRQARDAVLRRLNLPDSQDLQALPVVFWQYSLYDMSARIDPAALATDAARHWERLQGRPPDRIQLSSTVAFRNEALALAALDSLLTLRPATLRRLAISIRTATTYVTPPAVRWLLSPWIEQDVLPFQHNPYIQSDFAPTFVRLMGLASIAARILPSATETAVRDPLAALVVHAADVLDARYGMWLRTHDKPTKPNKNLHTLPASLTGLALFGYRQVQMAGQGELRHVPPETFLELLRHAAAGPFDSVILPRTILSWIEDAYRGAVAGAGQERWLPHIPEVYTRYRMSWQHDASPLRQRNATLLLRYICPNDPAVGVSLPSPDWRTSGRKWVVFGQDLLLTRPLPPSEWEQPEWPEPDWDAPDDKQQRGTMDRNTRRGTRLARAIERVASLSLADEFAEKVKDDQRTKKWWKDLRDCLSDVSSSQGLDRFTRLRLVELIDSESLRESSDDQLQIALLLLEYGIGYEVEQLLRRVFHGHLTAARQRVRSALLAAMRQHHASHTGAEEREARDPRAVRDTLQKHEVIGAWLLRLGFDATAPRQGADPVWAKECAKLLLRQHSVPRARLLEATIAKADGQPHATVQSDISDELVRAAVMVSDGTSATMLVDDLDVDGLENLFACQKEEYQARLESPPGTHLRVLARVVDIGTAKDGTRYAQFHCGMPWHLRRGLRADGELYIGDLVALSIAKREDGSWYCPFGDDLKAVPPRTRAGDVRRFGLHEESVKGEPGVWRLVLPRVWAGRFDVREWDADLSRRFRKPQSHGPRTVAAECRPDGTWVPACGNLLDLVLSACRFQGGELAVLTLISHDRQLPYGERTYQFSTEPGKNYRLFRRDFHDEAADQLDAEIARADDANGLLVTVIPQDRDRRVALSLVTGSAEDEELLTLYPHLKTPFDWRNLHWRRVFEDAGQLTAAKGDAGWVYRIDQDRIPGFPNIELVLRDQHLIGEIEHPEFDLEAGEWKTEDQWRRRSAYARPASCSLNVRREQWASFLKKWLELSRGDLVTLYGGGRVNRGSVVCFTPERMALQVDADSITMRRVRSDTSLRIDRDRPRQAIVYRDVRTAPSTPVSLAARFPADLDGFDYVEGIVYQVGDSMCSVLWMKGGEAVLQEGIEIAEPRMLGAAQKWERQKLLGKLIRGRRNGADGRYEVVWPMPKCRALWDIAEDAQISRNDLIYLGPVVLDGQQREVAEGEMGRLVVLQSKPLRAQHLAAVREVDRSVEIIAPGLLPDDPTDNDVAPHPPWSEATRKYQRAVLRFGNDVVVGRTYESAPRQHVGVHNVRMELIECDSGWSSALRLFQLNRTFELQKLAIRNDGRRESQGPDGPNWEAMLTGYANREDKDEPVRYERSQHTVILDRLRVPDGGRWTTAVPVHKDEQTYIADPEYADVGQAIVQLFQQPEGQWWASFRRVAPDDVESFRDRLVVQFGWSPGKPLPWSLHYCGPEESNPVTREAYDQTHHRFEWGYGKTLLVPQDRLKFYGGSFDNTKLLICHGDLITDLRFTDVGSSSHCDIDITGIYVDYNEVRSLYEQRSEMQIVHALHLRIERDEVNVEVVEGLNDRDVSNTPKPVRRSRARLHEEDEARLLQRASGTAFQGRPVVEMTILGRLDASEFERTSGKRVVFRHVRLTTAKDCGEAALRVGELLFMEGGNIRRGLNEVMLEVVHPELSPEDVGDEFKSLVILRRHFSLREDLLGRILEDEGPKALSGPILVRIARDHEGTQPRADEVEAPDDASKAADGSLERPVVRSGRASAKQLTLRSRVVLSIKELPARKHKVLAAALGGQQVVLAAASPLRKSGTGVRDRATSTGSGETVGWRLELRPGIFVELRSTEIEETPERIEQGDVVQIIQLPGGRMSLLPAAFGHSRYASGGPRPAVALPTNRLIRANRDVGENIWHQDFWQDGPPPFTVGDLPGLLNLRPGMYQSDRGWISPDPRECVRLMQCEHPKLVWLGVTGKGAPRVEPMIDTRCAGRLRVDNDLRVWYHPLKPLQATAGGEAVTWRGLSFGDEPARSILRRCRTERWRYHDETTTTWPAIGPEGRTEPLPQNQEVFSGPLFFDINAHHPPRLRYRGNELLRFGLPVDALIRSLRDHNGTSTYPVVGCSKNLGFWVEVAPGRIVEVPGRRVVCRLGIRGLRQLNVYWPAFAPGDTVTLSLAAREKTSREPDTIILDNWKPGPRGAFGSSDCFLPVQAFDEVEGALRAGHGEFSLTLPETRALLPGSSIILHPDNTIEEVHAQLPGPGDVVLLIADEEGILAIAGLPQLTPQLAPASALHGRLAEEFANPRKLASFIHAAGGAIPVTVTRVAGRVLSFSPRTGEAIGRLEPRTLSIARVVGYAAESKSAIIRFGASLSKVAMELIVEGLPPPCYAEAATRLKAIGVGIWIEGGSDEQIQIRRNEERTMEFSVEPLVDVCSGHQGTQHSGIICRSTDSGTLHWLPEECVAWTPLAPSDLSSIIKRQGASDGSGQRTIRVRQVGAHGAVSVVHVPSVVKEFEQLSVGTRITVRDLNVERFVDGRRTCLVESFASKMVFECVRHGNASSRPDEISVEVTHQSKQNGRFLLQAALPDERKHRLQLPAWMLGPLGTGELRRPQFLSYLDAVERGSIQSDPAGAIGDIGDPDLDKRLCCAYGAWRYRRTVTPDAFSVAQEWIRRYLGDPDRSAVDVIPALCAAVVFARCAQPSLHDPRVRRALTAFLGSLGRRALGSVHAECISRLWLCSRDPARRRERSGYWKRLNDSIIGRMTAGDLTTAQLAEVRRFCETVHIAGEARCADKPLVTIADALLAAMGRVAAATLLYPLSPWTRVCEELVLVSSSLNPSVQLPSFEVLDWCVGQRAEPLLDHVIQQSLDITLLQLVPEIRSEA